MTEIPEKECWLCKATKPLTEFYKETRALDGHQYNCKECQKRVNMEHYWRTKEENKEKLLSNRYQNNP